MAVVWIKLINDFIGGQPWEQCLIRSKHCRSTFTIPKVMLWSKAIGSFPLPVLLHTHSKPHLSEEISWRPPSFLKNKQTKTNHQDIWNPWSLSDFFSKKPSIFRCLASPNVLYGVIPPFLPQALGIKENIFIGNTKYFTRMKSLVTRNKMSFFSVVKCSDSISCFCILRFQSIYNWLLDAFLCFGTSMRWFP